MLVIDLTAIPAEGVDVDSTLEASALHLEATEEFTLTPGGQLRCRVVRGENGLVQVTGTLKARLGLTCGRCLEPYESESDGPVELVYLPRGIAGASDEDAVGLTDREMVVAYYDGEQLDLGEMVREQLLLNLSMKRLCRDDCRGLCGHCGANRNATSCDCAETDPVSPFGALGQLAHGKEPEVAAGPGLADAGQALNGQESH